MQVVYITLSQQHRVVSTGTVFKVEEKTRAGRWSVIGRTWNCDSAIAYCAAI